MKLNVLVFNPGYPPAQTYGGPSVSINNLVKELSYKMNFYIVCNSFELTGKEIYGISKNKRNVGGYQELVYFLEKGKMRSEFIENEIDMNNISIIYVNSFFNAKQLFLAIKLGKKYSIPLLIAPRGELEDNALLIKAYKKKPYIYLLKKLLSTKENIYFQATSKEEKNNISVKLEIADKKVFELDNIPTISQNKCLKTNEKEKNKIRMCFISRIQTKKNLLFAIESLASIDSKYDVLYDIYGPIENKEYWNKCEAIINKLPSHVEVRYKGMLSHDEVQLTFNEYHLFYFPTLSENFGHVIYESLSAGCPVLISDQTPWTDVNKFNCGKSLPLHGGLEFINYIEKIASMNNIEYEEVISNINIYLEEKINIGNIKKEYETVLEKISVIN